MTGAATWTVQYISCILVFVTLIPLVAVYPSFQGLTMVFHSFSRNRSRVVSSIIGTTGIVAALLLTSIAPAQAESGEMQSDDVSISALTYNGYYIKNLTNETLILEKNSIKQKFSSSHCEWHNTVGVPVYVCTAYGKGFGVEPPAIVPPTKSGEKGEYFEIPAYVVQGTTYDATSLIYSTTGGAKINLTANLSLGWVAGTRYDPVDGSSCTYAAGSCKVDPSQGKGTQTTFEIKNKKSIP